jgi:hypothetical protein
MARDKDHPEHIPLGVISEDEYVEKWGKLPDGVATYNI